MTMDVHAKDVPEVEVLALIERETANRRTAILSVNIVEAFSQFPAKVVEAKLKSLLRRGVIEPCPCGCGVAFRPAMVRESVG